MKTKKLTTNKTTKRKRKCCYCKKNEAYVTMEKDKVSFRICIDCIKIAVGNLL